MTHTCQATITTQLAEFRTLSLTHPREIINLCLDLQHLFRLISHLYI